MSPDQIFSEEACRILGISRATLTRWVARGDLKAAGRLAVANGAFYFDRAEVERVAANRAA